MFILEEISRCFSPVVRKFIYNCYSLPELINHTINLLFFPCKISLSRHDIKWLKIYAIFSGNDRKNNHILQSNKKINKQHLFYR